jgi:hypothetical protein
MANGVPYPPNTTTNSASSPTPTNGAMKENISIVNVTIQLLITTAAIVTTFWLV